MIFSSFHKIQIAVGFFLLKRTENGGLLTMYSSSMILYEISACLRWLMNFRKTLQAIYPITSTIDYYSDYNQIPVDKQSRDLTTFMTDVGLVRSIRLPQGWINSIAHYKRVMIKVHYRQIPHEIQSFLDDCDIKESKDHYNDPEISPGIRRFVYSKDIVHVWCMNLEYDDFR